MNIKIECPLCHGLGARDLNLPIGCTQCAGTGKIERTAEALMQQACLIDDEVKRRTAEFVAPLQDQLDTIKAALAAAVVAHGETLKTPFGRVEFVRGGERVTWDAKALEGYAAAHPEILKFKSVKATEPSARIKFEVKP
jgi:hypothetical protein